MTHLSHKSPANNHAKSAAKRNGITVPKPRPLRELDPSIEVIKPIPIVIRKADEGYVARFVKANVAASGDTRAEARENLKAMIVDTFENYLRHQAVLGIGPQQQLAALQSYLRPKSHADQAARR